MDGIGVTASSQPNALEVSQLKQLSSAAYQIQTPNKRDVDTIGASFSNSNTNLTVLANSILDKLDELLAAELPEGIRSLEPENFTPERTAQNIVDGTTALFGIYRQQNPDMEEEELIDSFMKTIRGGIQEGYEDAIGVLKGLGAFDLDGVQAGVEETMRLVEDKLSAFEAKLKGEEPAEEKEQTQSLETSKEVFSQSISISKVA